MATLNLHLTEELRSRLEARAAENGFDTVEAYVGALLLADSVGGPVTDDEQLESLLLGRLHGPFVEADDADFRQMRAKLQARLGGDSGPGQREPRP